MTVSAVETLKAVAISRAQVTDSISRAIAITNASGNLKKRIQGWSKNDGSKKGGIISSACKKQTLDDIALLKSNLEVLGSNLGCFSAKRTQKIQAEIMLLGASLYNI